MNIFAKSVSPQNSPVIELTVTYNYPSRLLLLQNSILTTSLLIPTRYFLSRTWVPSNLPPPQPPPPPQRNGRVPHYARNKLLELHRKFDELDNQGVFARPESLDITAEYLNPSFLMKKTSGGFCLATAFAEVSRYSKPQPSLMPDVDSTLRSIARWKYLITSDLTNAFYQIPLSKSSMKYCRVATPHRGVRVYTRWECLDLKRPLRNLCFVSSVHVIVFKTE